MSDIPSNGGSSHSVVYRAKELYLALFVVLFRFSGWKGRMKAGTASMAVSLVLIVLLMNIWTLTELASHKHVVVKQWWMWIIFFFFGLANDYYLVGQGHGVAFEKKFRGFSAGKRGVLYVAAISIILATAIAFYFLTAAYHRLLGFKS